MIDCSDGIYVKDLELALAGGSQLVFFIVFHILI